MTEQKVIFSGCGHELERVIADMSCPVCARKEIERLRSALQDIWDCEEPEGCPTCKLVARAALKGEAIAAIGDEKCRKCGGKMIDGVALMPAYAGAPDFPGDTGQERGCTISQVPSTDANLEGVRKCRECGWSVTGAAIGDDNNSPTEK